MFSARLNLLIILLLSLVSLAGCDGVLDDIKPSGDDNRPAVEAGSIGAQVAQQSPDFSMPDTLGNSRGLYDELATTDAVVLYFTMWCPTCETHMRLMYANVMPDFPNVSFFLVDYVMGSILYSRAAQEAYGYTGIETLVDIDQAVFNSYQASMGTTIVIDSLGIIRMNEDYKDGVKLKETLQLLP